jgi:hypothetical protein
MSTQIACIWLAPDKPEMHILAETLGDAEGVAVTKGEVGQTEYLPGFERLHEHEEGGTDSRYTG